MISLCQTGSNHRSTKAEKVLALGSFPAPAFVISSTCKASPETCAAQKRELSPNQRITPDGSAVGYRD